ncbi:MAG: c-type cytochrome [Bacteroidetes bacterium]|nr:c-type cytochrome [Bacteroidota bacterium]MCL5026512.1 c-type cytochrome [Chloroflexota bacterium]
MRAKLVWDGSYVRDIQPILDQYCVQCHGPGNPANGLRLDTYEGVMKGTQFGPVVIPGSPGSSTLVAVIKGTAAPEIRMPHQGRQLSPNRIENITLWIEAGAKKD